MPRLGIERIVLAGVSGRTLAFGPGWAEQSAAPGTPGRSLLAGHRDTHFRFLSELKRGDRLTLQAPDGVSLRYRVVDLSVIDERDGGLMNPRGEDELLLVTCYPFDNPVPGGNLRYLVRAAPLTGSGGRPSGPATGREKDGSVFKRQEPVA